MKSHAVDQVVGTEQTGSVTLVLGGVRSGKSNFAQDLAKRVGGDDVLFVATAQASFKDPASDAEATPDEEMVRRIEHHRRSRPSAWRTLEQPLNVARAISQTDRLPGVVLVDCLTLLVSNVLCAGEAGCDASDLESRVIDEVDALMEIAAMWSTNLIIVSGEVGCGIVPEHAMGRMFRDLLGLANQRIAAADAATYWMVAGMPILASAIASTLEQAAEQIKPAVAAGEAH